MKLSDAIKRVFGTPSLPTKVQTIEALKERERKAEQAAAAEFLKMREARMSYDTRLPSKDLDELEDRLDEVDKKMREALGQ